MCFTANDPFGGGSARMPHPHTIFRWRFHNDTEPSKSGYYYVYCEDIKDVLPQAKRLAELEKDEHGKALQREVLTRQTRFIYPWCRHVPIYWTNAIGNIWIC